MLNNEIVVRTIRKHPIPVLFNTSTFRITIDRLEGENWQEYKDTIIDSLQQAIDNFKRKEN